MPHSAFGHPHERGDCYATWFARTKAKELVGHFGFRSSDRDDIEQSLLVGLMERWPKFNAKNCSPQEFITWAIGRAVADLIREQERRREFEPVDDQPLEHLLRDEEEHLPASCIQEDHVPHLDRAIDLEHVLSSLPPEVQEVGRRLMQSNVCQVARELGISRRTVRSRMQTLREALEKAGYADA